MAHFLLQDVSRFQGGMHKAIGRIWAGYNTGRSWVLATLGTHWLTTQVSSNTGNASMKVHCNVRSGQLLINGMPLARLPLNYEANSTYRRLFGKVSHPKLLRHWKSLTVLIIADS